MTCGRAEVADGDRDGTLSLRFDRPRAALGYSRRFSRDSARSGKPGFSPADMFHAADAAGRSFAGRSDRLLKMFSRRVDLPALDEAAVRRSSKSRSRIRQLTGGLWPYLLKPTRRGRMGEPIDNTAMPVKGGGTMKLRIRNVLAGMALMAALPAPAELTVAQVAPMSGPIAAADGKSTNLGIRVALDAVNARGGVHGQKIVLRTLDDEYKPERTVELIRKEGAADTLALLLPVGSVSMAKVLKEKVLESARLPVVGIIPGAELLRTPLNPYLYHVRAGDLDQYRHIVEHTMTVGMKRYAVVYADIPFGKNGMTAIETLLKARDLVPVAGIPFALGPNIDFRSVIESLSRSAADVVVLISPPEPAGAFVREYRNAGLNPPVITLSYGLADVLCKVAGAEKAKGVGLVQVFPNGNSPTTPLSRRFQADFKRFSPADTVSTQNHFEAYVTTQVLLEALKRAGPAPTREKVVKALDGMKDVDLGGFNVDFSPGKHTGSRFVDISIVSSNCRLVF